jgi:hypothetical protein
VYTTLAAFIRMIAGHSRWPKMRWSYAGEPDDTLLTLHSDIAPTEARLFHVQAPTKDFRDFHWSFEPMQKAGGGFTARWPAPAEGYAAIFGEAVYDLEGQPFTLSTQIRILGGKR